MRVPSLAFAEQRDPTGGSVDRTIPLRLVFLYVLVSRDFLTARVCDSKRAPCVIPSVDIS